MEPELGKVEPISYARVISPILTKKCFPCHQGKNGAPTNAAYNAMEPYSFWFASAGDNRVKGHGGSRSKAGQIGALGSRMGKALLNDTHQKALADGTYTAMEARTLTQWLDLGSDELGSFDDDGAQRRGELVWPTLDVDKNDPQGLKYVLESPYVERKDAGADLPKADAAPSMDTSSTSNGGSTSTGGVVATGGQSGVPSTSGSGGNAGAVASGGKTGSGGSAGSQSPVASGGKTGSGGSSGSAGSVGTGGAAGSTAGRVTGSGCRMGAESSMPAHAWILFVTGIALFVRGRRRPR